jgi:hypothetical protein
MNEDKDYIRLREETCFVGVNKAATHLLYLLCPYFVANGMTESKKKCWALKDATTCILYFMHLICDYAIQNGIVFCCSFYKLSKGILVVLKCFMCNSMFCLLFYNVQMSE